MALTVITDYTGFYSISQTDFNKTSLAAYITKYEQKYLIDLFGKTLYDLFIADLSGSTSQAARFVTLRNALTVNEYVACNDRYEYGYWWFNRSVKKITSQGINDMLKGFVYFHFMRDQRLQSQATGINISKSETSRESEKGEFASALQLRFNEAITSYMAIQIYMMNNSGTYPEFDGQKKEYIL